MAKTPEFMKSRASYRDRYRLTQIHIDDSVRPNTRRFGLWEPLDIDMSEYDQYAVKEGDDMRPDLIAWTYYKDTSLWWIICFVNDIAFPFEDIQVGTILKIPKIKAISDAFARIVKE